MPSDRYAVKSVEIGGFRGYRDPQRLDLNGQSCMFFGGNRSGKSSTLGAIEWCLFGEFASLRGETTGTLDELVNDHSPRASVTIELQGPSGVVKVVRTKSRGTKITKLEATTPDGKVCKDEEARKTLYKLIGLEFDDFTRAVYLHQEDIRDLIVGDRDTRSVAMDRLLGLDQLRNVSEGLKPKPVRDAISEIQAARDEVVAAITGRIQEANKHHVDAVNKAAEKGLTGPHLSLDAGNTISAKIFDNLTEIAGEVQLEVQKVTPAKSGNELSGYAAVARTIIEKIRKRLPETKQINELTEEQARIIAVKSDYSAAVSRLNLATESVRTYEKENGGKTSIEGKIEATQSRTKELNAERDQIDAKQKTIKDGLKYLDEFTDVKNCPICQRTIEDRDELLKHLRKEAKEKISAKLVDIDAKIEKETKKEDGLEGILRKLDRLHGDEERASKELEQKIIDVSSALSRPIKAGENVAAILDAELGKIKRKILKFQKPLEERERKFEEIESQVGQLLAIAEVVNKKQRVDELLKLQQSEELKKAEDALTALSGLEYTVNMVGDCVRGLQTELAPALVDKGMPAIKKIYDCLVAHPYYSELKIEVEPSSRGALKNIYNIKALNPSDGGETLVCQRFSTGDMNCVALSVFLGLAQQDTYSHKAGFLIIDDPSQSLERERKEELVRLFSSTHERQLLIASEDEVLLHLLDKAIDWTHVKKVEFGKWDEQGVKVRS